MSSPVISVNLPHWHARAHATLQKHHFSLTYHNTTAVQKFVQLQKCNTQGYNFMSNVNLRIKCKNIKQRAHNTTNRKIVRSPADKRDNVPAGWMGGAETCLLCREPATSRLCGTALHTPCSINVNKIPYRYTSAKDNFLMVMWTRLKSLAPPTAL